MWEVFTEGIAILITLSFIYCIFGVFADERNSGGKYFPVVTAPPVQIIFFIQHSWL